MTTYKGRCHCGAYEWEVILQANEANHILCHCQNCKILSGGPYTMNQVIPMSQLNITKGGKPSVYTYIGDSGNKVHSYYCGNCTTHVYHHQEVMGAEIIVRTNVLAEARNLPVGMEIYAKDRYGWVGEVAETYAEAPPWPPATELSNGSTTGPSTNGAGST